MTNLLQTTFDIVLLLTVGVSVACLVIAIVLLMRAQRHRTAGAACTDREFLKTRPTILNDPALYTEKGGRWLSWSIRFMFAAIVFMVLANIVLVMDSLVH